MKITKRMKNIFISLCCALLCVVTGLLCSVNGVFSVKAADDIQTTSLMYCDGASIRLADDGKSGIRFHVRVNSDTEGNALDKSSNTIYTKKEFLALTTGILVIPADKLAGAELTVGETYNGARPANVTGTECVWTLKQDGDNYYYEATAYVYNIPETSYDREFTFRGYYTVDGKTYYTKNENNTRCVSNVALRAKIEDNTDKANGETGYESNENGTGKLDILNGFLPATLANTHEKFVNKDSYLYRVGNGNAVEFTDLINFEIIGDGLLEDIEKSEIFSFESVNGNVSCTVDNANETLQFSGTGIVKLTFNKIEGYTRSSEKTEEMLFEVVDANNATSATSATANNVVLLNDISGTFTVSNGYTFYGNGFTVTLPTASVQNLGNGFTGYISIGASQDDGVANGGHLDNVRIEGPVYPEMYIYRDQAKIADSSDADYGDGFNMRYFKNSVIIYGGNCTISNSYISGSRTALCLRGGNNVVIENTTLAGGSYANMQICAGSNITLRNLTTVQVDVSDSYGKGKTAHGLGIAVDSNVVDLYIEGELNQYNWLCEEQWNSIVPSNYQSTFPKFFTNSTFSNYWHYLNGGTAPYVNMAFIYACNWDTSKIHDNRATVNYGTADATIASVNGGVYSKLNTVGGNAIADANLADPGYTSPGFNPVAPTFNFDNTANNDVDDANDANDTYCVYNESNSTLKIGVNGDSKTIDLSGVTVAKNGTKLTHTVYLNGTQINGNSVTIKAADGAKQTLTFKATSNDVGYDKDGEPISGSIEYTWTVTVELATLSYPAPEWNMGGDYQFDKTNCVYAYYATSSGYGEAVPIYEGIKINYYDKTGKLVNLDLSGTTTHPTGSNNSNSNAFTYTLADGSILTMKFSSGWKSGATTHQFTTYNNKVYIYPQSLDNDNYIRSSVKNQDFDVKISYTFTDPNGQSISQTMQWYNAKSDNGNVKTVQWKTFDGTNGKNASICIVEDTMIMLADGTQKPVEDLQVGDMLLVFNHFEGKYEQRPFIIDVHADDAPMNYRVLNMMFSNGESWRIAGYHTIFDSTLEKYVTIGEENVEQYIGHKFYHTDGRNSQLVELTGCYVTEEFIKVYSPTTYEFGNYFANGFLNAPPLPNSYTAGQMNYFDFDENMMYDKAQVQADIEMYGLYTYEDFADYISEEVFNALPFKYFKISVGKGLMTWEEIFGLLEMM